MRLVLFGGKGGVGKTTCAAAAAVQLAEAGCRRLLISSDPAHSLADCLEQAIGPAIRELEGVENLSALEVSAERLSLKLKEEHGGALRRILEPGALLDERALDGLCALSIPGLDELMLFNALVELLEQGEYDFYIVDMALAGQTQRLLAFLGLLDDWLRVLARIGQRDRDETARSSRRQIDESAGDLLGALRRTAQKIQGLLRDPDRCEFVVVTVPEAKALAETRRLVEELARLKIPVRHLVVNRVISSEPGACPLCLERKQEQRGLLQECERTFSQCTIFYLLERPYQVKGIQRLRTLEFPVHWLREPVGAADDRSPQWGLTA